MRRLYLVAVVGMALAVPGLSNAADPAAPNFDPQSIEFFERDIPPRLVERCYKCHGEGDEIKWGLKLNSQEAILSGGDSGPAAVPGNLKESLIVEAVRYQDGAADAA